MSGFRHQIFEQLPGVFAGKGPGGPNQNVGWGSYSVALISLKGPFLLSDGSSWTVRQGGSADSWE